ncbi:hydrogenase nickel incorporation protein HypA/HybF [Actinomadura hallensis]|uniref:Hydrogenase maturation factor HypA n=1 Tax=Actinomadura hallensis TaxID=337895 RepID=A0A543IAX2_9ACTN|nr:hydrogenase/urease maturation nickel metallochaperone HypA [Actinomadura hallensis]TQM67742.1 hydrogenase nickel incorporation protein HypA/HybF [Actinomadura hallensis]HLV75097.1 hydrogenase/urease maturation nickel metallochaperone HypA [Vulgatibacteraceae bacterium]
MHELGMCEGIVEAALRRADGRPVRGMRVRIGGHPVDPEVIEQGVRVAAAGTAAEDAALDLVLEPLAVRCGRCRARTPVNSAAALAACPACGSVDVESTGREDVVLESITVDAPVGEPAGGPARD